MLRFILIALLVAFPAATLSQTVYKGTVYYDSGSNSYKYKAGAVDKNGAAYGTFTDSLFHTGWGTLQLETNGSYADPVQMYAAGYLEGALTWTQIWPHYQNMYAVFFTSQSPPSKKLLNWLQTQENFVKNNTNGDYSKLPDYWKQVKLIQQQFDGLYAGYNALASSAKKLEYFAFQMLNGVGDFLDLLNALEPERRPNYDAMTKDELFRNIALNGRCSALVKINGDLSDLWSAHSAWFVYAATNRIFKHYSFDLSGKFVASKRVSFSSYPGFLESLDDFYIMSNGLVMLQTTNNIFNHTIYEKVTPYSLLAWQRVRLACSMAHDGHEWSKLMGEHNSGTYNNQYMVIDYNKFKRGQEIQQGILWVSEQIPGLFQYADVTDQLERGYWASYNVPYFPEIYSQSGYPEFVHKHGIEFSYQMAPRAEIFRRDQGKVVDLESFKNIMRSNNYKTDPYAKGDPVKAICARGDLEPSGATPGGCYDTKVTSYDLRAKMISQVINGPTTFGGIPPFKWSAFNSTSHVGLPTVYDYDFVVMDPKWDQF